MMKRLSTIMLFSITLMTCSCATPQTREQAVAAPVRLTAVQQEQVATFVTWARTLDIERRALMDSPYKNDVKIQSLAVTSDNYVCATVWFRGYSQYHPEKEYTHRYVLPPDMARPLLQQDDHGWEVFGCNTATQVKEMK
ncbi:MAG: hypothetical protein LAN64_01845 [Acidobacteriia bacterium]|nr:hypothetical protein [Terriglobia bacterium]